MRRRDFIALLSGAAVVWVRAEALAAQKSPLARIGFLYTGAPQKECCASPECISLVPEAYQNSACYPAPDLHALGWREGENYRLDARFARNDPTILPRLAAELVALNPDILIAAGTTETKALQTATSDIPIVFMMSSDPVGMGIVDSIARPGRNTTGTSKSPVVLWGKRLEIIAELIGHVPSKVGWLCNPGNFATESNQAALMQSADRTRGRARNSAWPFLDPVYEPGPSRPRTRAQRTPWLQRWHPPLFLWPASATGGSDRGRRVRSSGTEPAARR
jgi:ABC transporter substrate binding protein